MAALGAGGARRPRLSVPEPAVQLANSARSAGRLMALMVASRSRSSLYSLLRAAVSSASCHVRGVGVRSSLLGSHVTQIGSANEEVWHGVIPSARSRATARESAVSRRAVRARGVVPAPVGSHVSVMSCLPTAGCIGVAPRWSVGPVGVVGQLLMRCSLAPSMAGVSGVGRGVMPQACRVDTALDSAACSHSVRRHWTAVRGWPRAPSQSPR